MKLIKFNPNNKKFKLSFSVFAFSLLLFSCTNDTKKTEMAINITGKYINHSHLETVSNSDTMNSPFYCTELTILANDSVFIDTGSEGTKLAYKKEGDVYLIENASSMGDMTFIVHDDSTVTLIDTAWTKKNTNSEFKKVNPKSNWTFANFLNNEIIAGDYTLYENGKQTHKKVNFSIDGQVSGLDNLSNYSICYSGDCMELIDTPDRTMHTITMNDSDGRWIAYAFKRDKIKGVLIFFKISEPIKDIKGGMKVQEMIYELEKVDLSKKPTSLTYVNFINY